MNFHEQLGWTIVHAREAQDMSMGELAAETGISPSYLSEVERGTKRITFHKLVPIAKRLGLSLDAMVEHDHAVV